MNHFYQNIQGMFRWPEMYERAVRMAPDKATFVEIGCFKGQSTACLAVEAINSGKDIVIYAIDLWDKRDSKISCSLDEFRLNMFPVLGILAPIRSDSIKAAKLFDDESVDFVWIDGGHSYQQVLGDLRAWWPKMKNGGWMGGDDLILGGVAKAVNEFFGPECLPGKRKDKEWGNWVRFQSATVVKGGELSMIPSCGGWVWWARSKTKEWNPVGAKC